MPGHFCLLGLWTVFEANNNIILMEGDNQTPAEGTTDAPATDAPAMDTPAMDTPAAEESTDSAE